jgi:hypothetical protein
MPRNRGRTAPDQLEPPDRSKKAVGILAPQPDRPCFERPGERSPGRHRSLKRCLLALEVRGTGLVGPFQKHAKGFNVTIWVPLLM